MNCRSYQIVQVPIVTTYIHICRVLHLLLVPYGNGDRGWAMGYGLWVTNQLCGPLRVPCMIVPRERSERGLVRHRIVAASRHRGIGASAMPAYVHALEREQGHGQRVRARDPWKNKMSPYYVLLL